MLRRDPVTFAGERAPLTLRVQVVLFLTPLAQLWRLITAVGAAGHRAKTAGRLSRLDLAFGDCSPAPLLGPPDVEQLRERASARGISSFSYEFFAENLGSAGASNRLAQDADADYLLVLNPDTYPAPDLLVELLRVFDDPAVGVAEGRQIPLEHPKEYDVRSGDTSWASGCCLLVPRAVFESVGGFDTANFFLHCDDVDLSWRVRLAGRRIVHVPTAVVFHDKRIGVDGKLVTPPTETYHGTLGRLMLARKYRRQDVLAETLAWSEQHGTPAHRQAAAEYRRREALGNLPAPLEGAARVAQFVGNDYAVHRF